MVIRQTGTWGLGCLMGTQDQIMPQWARGREEMSLKFPNEKCVYSKAPQ